jgi:hypothetical protein
MMAGILSVQRALWAFLLHHLYSTYRQGRERSRCHIYKGDSERVKE